MIIKSKLIAAIAHRSPHLTEKEVELSVNHLLECFSSAMVRGERVEVRGFGSFERRYLGPRQTHNPKTGEKLNTAGKYTPWFKAGKELKERCR